MTMADKNNPPILLAVTISSFLAVYGFSAECCFADDRREYSMSALALSWVISSFLLAATITLVPLGRISDIYGRKKFFFMAR